MIADMHVYTLLALAFGTVTHRAHNSHLPDGYLELQSQHDTQADRCGCCMLAVVRIFFHMSTVALLSKGNL